MLQIKKLKQTQHTKQAAASESNYKCEVIFFSCTNQLNRQQLVFYQTISTK